MRWAYPAAALACAAALGIGAYGFWPDRGASDRPLIPNASVTDLLPHADAARGARLFRQCAACHPIGQGAPDRNGPNLYGILGAPVAGARTRSGYTYALRSVGGRWDAERMDAWLRNPQQFAPGTRMFFDGVSSAWDRADLIAYLGTQGSEMQSGAAAGKAE